MSQQAQLAGRIIAITGGASGIGAACAEVAAARGAGVAVLDLNIDQARAVADRIGGQAFHLDVTEEQSVVDAIASYSPETDASKRAWILTERAMAKAVEDLVNEANRSLGTTDDVDPTLFDFDADQIQTRIEADSEDAAEIAQLGRRRGQELRPADGAVDLGVQAHPGVQRR